MYQDGTNSKITKNKREIMNKMGNILTVLFKITDLPPGNKTIRGSGETDAKSQVDIRVCVLIIFRH